jgi:hypothetical protein
MNYVTILKVRMAMQVAKLDIRCVLESAVVGVASAALAIPVRSKPLLCLLTIK